MWTFAWAAVGPWTAAAFGQPQAGEAARSDRAGAAPERTHRVLDSPPKGYTETRLLRFRYVATNTTGRTLDEATYRVSVPAVRTSQHALLRVECSAPCTLVPDALGNAQLGFSVGPLAPFATSIVTVTAEVAVALQSRPVELPRAEEPRYLAAEPFVEIDDPALVELAKAVVPGVAKRQAAPEPMPPAARRKAARKIHQWVMANITKSGYSSRERGALWALEHNEGDATEMALAFVALARLSGIPARFVGGYVIESSALLAPEEFHHWAEWYDGKAWRLADGYHNSFDYRPQRHIATQLSVGEDGRQWSRWVSDTAGLDVKMMGRN